MRCPFCHTLETKVIDSRNQLEGDQIRRRRECLKCSKRFTTHEVVERHLPAIVKSDGRREAYQRQKILGGLKKSCQKRPVSIQQLDEMLDKIEKILADGNLKEVRAIHVGELIMNQLYIVDPVAYVRFASFYWNFQDVDDFVKGLQQKRFHISEVYKEKENEIQ
jgi:transcriptional repressor NrdR